MLKGPMRCTGAKGMGVLRSTFCCITSMCESRQTYIAILDLGIPLHVLAAKAFTCVEFLVEW